MSSINIYAVCLASVDDRRDNTTLRRAQLAAPDCLHTWPRPLAGEGAGAFPSFLPGAPSSSTYIAAPSYIVFTVLSSPCLCHPSCHACNVTPRHVSRVTCPAPALQFATVQCEYKETQWPLSSLQTGMAHETV